MWGQLLLYGEVLDSLGSNPDSDTYLTADINNVNKVKSWEKIKKTSSVVLLSII